MSQPEYDYILEVVHKSNPRLNRWSNSQKYSSSVTQTLYKTSQNTNWSSLLVIRLTRRWTSQIDLFWFLVKLIIIINLRSKLDSKILPHHQSLGLKQHQAQDRLYPHCELGNLPAQHPLVAFQLPHPHYRHQYPITKHHNRQNFGFQFKLFKELRISLHFPLNLSFLNFKTLLTNLLY